MYVDPPRPDYYLCHVDQRALIAHRPVLFWDGHNWCSDSSPSRHVQAVQQRYWCGLNGGQIHLSKGRPGSRIGLFDRS